MEPVDDFLDGLKSRETSVAIWGAGAIGSSAAYYLAQAGCRCIALDISLERVRDIEQGRFQSTSSAEITSGQSRNASDLGVRATTDWRDLESERVAIHLVCIPTERAAEPSSAALADVIPNIGKVIRATPVKVVPPIVSIESTILPSWIAAIVHPGLESAGLKLGRDVLVGAAPRRDWFNGASFTIQTLPRVVGGCDDRTSALLAAFYGLVCDTVQPAMDAQHAAFTKVIENVIRYEGITFGNRLALAFPEYDMRHVLRLASTKWNIPYYFPSLGIGGHCIPLAPRYAVEEGGADNRYLQSIHDSITFNDHYFESLYDCRLQPLLKGKRSVGVLGLGYTADAKMHKLSPAFAVLDALRNTPRLRLHDPYYSADEIYDLCSVPRMRFPEDVAGCDALILVTPHSEYVRSSIESEVKSGTVVVDNTGVWAGRKFAGGVEYYEIGRVRGRPAPMMEPFSSTAD